MMFLKKLRDSNHRSNLKLYAVFPDFWKAEWGRCPFLGYVRAYDEFHAIRKAYDKKLLPLNKTFCPKVVEQLGK